MNSAPEAAAAVMLEALRLPTAVLLLHLLVNAPAVAAAEGLLAGHQWPDSAACCTCIASAIVSSEPQVWLLMSRNLAGPVACAGLMQG